MIASVSVSGRGINWRTTKCVDGPDWYYATLSAGCLYLCIGISLARIRLSMLGVGRLRQREKAPNNPVPRSLPQEATLLLSRNCLGPSCFHTFKIVLARDNIPNSRPRGRGDTGDSKYNCMSTLSGASQVHLYTITSDVNWMVTFASGISPYSIPGHRVSP